MHREKVDQGRPVQDLEPEALFCIAVLRTWVAANRPDGAALPDWRAVCAQGELPDGAMQAFGAFLNALHRGMRRPLDIRCRPCPQVGRDEEALLALLGFLQCGDALSALDVLSDWLEPSAVMPALPIAMRLATAASECEIRIHIPTALSPGSGWCNGPARQMNLH